MTLKEAPMLSSTLGMVKRFTLRHSKLSMSDVPMGG